MKKKLIFKGIFKRKTNDINAFYIKLVDSKDGWEPSPVIIAVNNEGRELWCGNLLVFNNDHILKCPSVTSDISFKLKEGRVITRDG
jgi:hypothetical protein